jgi:hypothetical protein
MADKKMMQTHPMVIFWLGVLTGVVALALMSFYSAMNADPVDYQTSMFRYFYNPYSSLDTTTLNGYGDPTYLNGGGTTSINGPTGG